MTWTWGFGDRPKEVARPHARRRVLTTRSLPVRAAGVVATALAAIAFVPLGLVLPPGAWVPALAFAGAVSTGALVGFAAGRLAAFAAPIVLIAAWFLVQR